MSELPVTRSRSNKHRKKESEGKQHAQSRDDDQDKKEEANYEQLRRENILRNQKFLNSLFEANDFIRRNESKVDDLRTVTPAASSKPSRILYKELLEYHRHTSKRKKIKRNLYSISESDKHKPDPIMIEVYIPELKNRNVLLMGSTVTVRWKCSDETYVFYFQHLRI